MDIPLPSAVRAGRLLLSGDNTEVGRQGDYTRVSRLDKTTSLYHSLTPRPSLKARKPLR
jgi:hypothetical protein